MCYYNKELFSLYLNWDKIEWGCLMKDRITALRNELEENSLDAVLVFKNENRRYISGFTGTSGYVIITEKSAYFITDFRYIGQATDQCQGYEIIEHNNDKSIFNIINSLGIKKIGFEEDFVTYSQYTEFKDKLDHVTLLPLNGSINKLRKYKDENEIEDIAMAAYITDEAFGYICEFIKPAVSERNIAMELENFMRRKGASKISFDIIVASGVRSALPHGVASEKLVEKGDFVTMDFGCVYNGYCSDMTRTIVVGQANEKQKKIYNTVLETQLKALDAIRPGITGFEVDKVARDIITEKGYGDYFGHGLGHGVGLEIHEAPRLSPLGKDTLAQGMVVTVEPGIYIPDFGGVRIEDLLVVTEESHRILSKSPKQLIEL